MPLQAGVTFSTLPGGTSSMALPKSHPFYRILPVTGSYPPKEVGDNYSQPTDFQ